MVHGLQKCYEINQNFYPTCHIRAKPLNISQRAVLPAILKHVVSQLSFQVLML